MVTTVETALVPFKGKWSTRRVVIIKFDNYSNLAAWLKSEERREWIAEASRLGLFEVESVGVRLFLAVFPACFIAHWPLSACRTLTPWSR